MNDIKPLERFCRELHEIAARHTDEAETAHLTRAPLAALLDSDDWLPDRAALSSGEHYLQHLLFLDEAKRFCVVSFVWRPGQGTPVHNHLTWGLVGVLNGIEMSQPYTLSASGKPVAAGPPVAATRGSIDTLGSGRSDLHRVWNGRTDGVTISIHVYGADIATIDRDFYDAAGDRKKFRSTYASLPGAT